MGVGVGGGEGGGEGAGRVELILDGETAPGRTTFLVNGERRSLPDSKFVVLLRLVAAHERAAGGWTSRALLKIVQRDTTTRIREGSKGRCRRGFELVEEGSEREI